MGDKLRRRSLPILIALAVGVSLNTSTVKVNAGYASWEEVPADVKKRVEAVWKYFISDAKWAEGSAAGTLSNANSESGWDPYLQQSGGPAWGFYQMEADRQANLKAYMQSKDAMNDPVKGSVAASEFAVEELKKDNIFLTYGLEGDANGTGRYAGPQQWGPLYRYDVLKYVQPTGKEKISASYDEFIKNTDPAKGAVEFMVSYERANSNPGTLHLDQRVGMAKAIYQEYSGKVAPSSDNKDGDGKESKKSESTAQSLMEWDEDAIPNMPKDRDYKETDDSINKLFTNPEDLTADEKSAIANWKAERDSKISKQAVQLARKSMMLVAFALIIYAAIILLAYCVDLWTPVGDSLAMRFVTGNRRAIDYERSTRGIWFADKKENRHLEVKRMGVGDVLIWGAIFTLIGVGLMSGYLYMQFGNLANALQELVGYALKK